MLDMPSNKIIDKLLTILYKEPKKKKKKKERKKEKGKDRIITLWYLSKIQPKLISELYTSRKKIQEWPNLGST